MKRLFSGFSHAVIALSLLTAGYVSDAMPASPPHCITPESIERLNDLTEDDRLFRLQGKYARMFLALDPRVSDPTLVGLMERDIDELIAWNIRVFEGSRLGAAVPFSNGCAVEGYGEPDTMPKLWMMKDTVDMIAKGGTNDPALRSVVRHLFDMPSQAEEAEIDAIVERIRRLAPELDVAPDRVPPMLSRENVTGTWVTYYYDETIDFKPNGEVVFTRPEGHYLEGNHRGRYRILADVTPARIEISLSIKGEAETVHGLLITEELMQISGWTSEPLLVKKR